MMVIVVAQNKGGVGKTTVAVNVAGDMTRDGRVVVLVDADPQGGAFHWAEPRKLSFPVRHEVLTLSNRLMWTISVLKTESDFLILDLPAGFGPVFDTALMMADLLVVPCGPSSLDIGGAERTITKAREIRKLNPSSSMLKIAIVPTKVDLAHEEGTQIVDALIDLGEPVAPSLSYDVEFVRCYSSGITVTSGGHGTRAAGDIRELSHFLLKHLRPRVEKRMSGLQPT